MEALPEAAADFLYSSEMGAVVKAIADKHSLHIDQMGLLEAETGQLILGLTEPQDFAPYITESLKVSSEQATAIAKDVQEQIMGKIRASMGQPGAASSPAPSMPVASSAPSVVMPSSSPKPVVPAAPIASTPAPLRTPPAPAPAPSTTVMSTSTPAPQAAATPTLAKADAILSEKKVTPPAATPTPASAAPAAPKADPAQPQLYKADPYREPVE